MHIISNKIASTEEFKFLVLLLLVSYLIVMATTPRAQHGSDDMGVYTVHHAVW